MGKNDTEEIQLAKTLLQKEFMCYISSFFTMAMKTKARFLEIFICRKYVQGRPYFLPTLPPLSPQQQNILKVNLLLN